MRCLLFQPLFQLNLRFHYRVQHSVSPSGQEGVPDSSSQMADVKAEIISPAIDAAPKAAETLAEDLSKK